MIKYFFKRVSCSLIAVVLTFSIVGLCLSVLFVGCFSNEQYVARRIDENKGVIINEINSEVKALAAETGLPESAYVNAVNETNFNIVSDNVAKNLKYCYRTDFSGDSELYSIYYKSITAAARESGKNLKSNEASKNASLAVYTASRVINAEDTNVIPLFRAIRGKTFVTLVVTTVVLTILSVLGIELINKGRHRKFSYWGMSITSAGYISIILNLFTKKMNYVGKNQFISYEPYNLAIQNAVNDMLKIMYPIGIFLVVFGFIMLAFNYNYFRKKNEKAVAEKEFAKRLVTDFLEYDEPNISHRLSNGEGFEKEITKIDFD